MSQTDFAEVEDFVNFGFEQASLEVGVALGDKLLNQIFLELVRSVSQGREEELGSLSEERLEIESTVLCGTVEGEATKGAIDHPSGIHSQAREILVVVLSSYRVQDEVHTSSQVLHHM